MTLKLTFLEKIMSDLSMTTDCSSLSPQIAVPTVIEGLFMSISAPAASSSVFLTIPSWPGGKVNGTELDDFPALKVYFTNRT